MESFELFDDLSELSVCINGRNYRCDFASLQPILEEDGIANWLDEASMVVPNSFVENSIAPLLNPKMSSIPPPTNRAILQFARAMRDSYRPDIAATLTRSWLERKPFDTGGGTILCSTLRKLGQPLEALRETNSIPRSPALWTSRGAAFADLEEWILARQQVSMAMGISCKETDKWSKYAQRLLWRVVSNRPDLSERPGEESISEAIGTFRRRYGFMPSLRQP